jgi:HSP20 family protein
MAEESAKVPVKSEERPGGGMLERPWESLMSLRDEIDRMFDEIWSGGMLSPFRRRRQGLTEPFRGTPLAWGAGMPAVDVIDKEKEVQVRAELPGMDEKDIDVRLSDGTLIIRGEKKEEREEREEGRNYYVSERRYGSFQRSIPIPEGVDRDKVDASFQKGVLTITLPKTPEAQQKAKKIEVKGEK